MWSGSFQQIVKHQLDTCLRLVMQKCRGKVNTHIAVSFLPKRRHFVSTSSFFCKPPLDKSTGVKEATIEERLTPVEWTQPFKLPEPDLDWPYLLDDENEYAIIENINQRKGIGDVKKMKDRKEELWHQFVTEALDIPNMSHSETAVGDESQAKQLRICGDKKDFPVNPRNVNIVGSKGLRMLREENLTFACGSKTYYLEADLARLERALVSYSLDYLLNKGFELVSVPDLLFSGVIDMCGFKTTSDRSQVYHLHPDCLGGACLAGTAEMSLAGYFMNEVLTMDKLPKRMVAASKCYRAEAVENASEKGLYRVHHFTKVEMFGLTANEDGNESDKLLSEFLEIEQELFSALGIHFRVLDMPTQELGAPAHRKYDIEAWMYGKKIWGEISSCSNCTDFQSRRLNIRYKSPTSGQLKHVHTVNGTACAVPRMITTILEQNQEPKMRITIPKVLHKYMDGQTYLRGTGKRSTSTFIKTLRKV